MAPVLLPLPSPAVTGAVVGFSAVPAAIVGTPVSSATASTTDWLLVLALLLGPLHYYISYTITDDTRSRQERPLEPS
jgi:hypothetical protein